MSDKPAPAAVPIYVNLVKLLSREREYFLDIITVYPPIDMPTPDTPMQGTVVGRYVMSPQQAKALSIALDVNLQRYEEAHGPIDPPPAPTNVLLN